MLHRVPNRQGGFTTCVEMYAVVLMLAVVVGIGVLATMFARSQPCSTAKLERNYYQAEAMRLEREADIYGPYALIGIGIIDSQYRRLADRLEARTERRTGNGVVHMTKQRYPGE